MSDTATILIGGPPGAGKTTLGRAVAARFDAVSLTADDLLTAVQGVTTPDTHPGLHVMRTGDSIAYFTDRTPDQLVADAGEQADALWPAVRQVIERHARTGVRLVLDGWMLRPERVAELNAGRGDAPVRPYWLVPDMDVLESRERTANAEFFDASTNPPRMLENFLARSRWCRDLVAADARRLGQTVLEQDGSRSVDDLCRDVTGEVDG